MKGIGGNAPGYVVMAKTNRAWISDGFECLLSDLALKQVDNPFCPDFDVVIVGSGYGGAMAAAQLSSCSIEGRSLRVCVLERGREYLPGSFPRRFADIAGHLRCSSSNSASVFGQRTGLFDFRFSPHLNTLVANGLGGGSLINAGVMESACGEVFDDRWPDELQGGESLKAYYAKAKQLLGAEGSEGANTIENHREHQQQALSKYKATQILASTGTKDSSPFRPASLTVAMADKINGAGVELKECQLCGDCSIGCNHSAKESLDTNLLVSAWKNGAQIYTGATVLRLFKSSKEDFDLQGKQRTQDQSQNASQEISDLTQQDHWCLEVVHTDKKLRQREKPLILKAAKIVLAAGSFGSTEILLRSQNNDLAFSSQLGQKFSGNGDMLAVGFAQEEAVNTIADENVDPGMRRIGPSITGVIDLRREQDLGPSVIEEISVPGALKRLFEESVTSISTFRHLEVLDKSQHQYGQAQGDAYSVSDEDIAHTNVFALMGDDGADGALVLTDDNIEDGDLRGDGAIAVHWPQLSSHPVFHRHVQALECLSRRSGLGGQVQANPLWQMDSETADPALSVPRGPMLTVHPLGGCVMANDRNGGVVDHLGRVFDGAESIAPTKLHDGLVVLDGSVMASSIGINPALTIAAIALRALEGLKQEWCLQEGREVSSTEQASLSNPQGDKLPITRPVQRRCSRALKGKPTVVQISERLSGLANLTGANGHPRLCAIELTLYFDNKAVLELVRGSNRVLRINEDDGREPDQVGDGKSRVRVFDSAVWQKLLEEDASEARMSQCALMEAPLSGTLELCLRSPSSPYRRQWRALWAWWRNRGMRDIYLGVKHRVRGALRKGDKNNRRRRPINKLWPGLRSKLGAMLALASHAGEQRLFEYKLSIHQPAEGWSGELQGFEGEELPLYGTKTITYKRRCSPLRQLEDMDLLVFPGLQPKDQQVEKKYAVIKYDARFLAYNRQPLIKIVGQEDLLTAMADMAAFFSYFARLFIGIHLWSFKKPSESEDKSPQRLPGRIRGLPKPEVKEIKVGDKDVGLAFKMPIKVRLTRYRGTGGSLAPLVLIHGYSASGNTYTHASIKPSLAEYFWHRHRDIWVVDLRTSSAMPTAMFPWTFEEVAFADIPVAMDYICRTTQQEQCDVVAHCMGAAMLSMSVLSPPKGGDSFYLERCRLPQRIRRVVLSQVGPRVSFTQANVFRAHIFNFVRELMPFVAYSFYRSDDPSMVEQLIDRLFSGLPYPDDDYDLENPAKPWVKTPFVGARHRMDALYGRTFSLKNLSPGVLENLCDLFGPMNMQTLSQVISFALRKHITNKQGQNEFVTPERLRRYWTFPTLSVHGEENGLVDVSTLSLMSETMNAAGCIFEARRLPGFGHQDTLIGKDAAVNFKVMEDFFDRPDSTLALTPTEREVRLKAALPYSGPVIGKLRTVAEEKVLPLSIGVSPEHGNPEFVCFIAVKRNKGGVTVVGDETVLAKGLSLENLAQVCYLKLAKPKRDDWIKLCLPIGDRFNEADGVIAFVIDDPNVSMEELVTDEMIPENLLTINRTGIVYQGCGCGKDRPRTLVEYVHRQIFCEAFIEQINSLLQKPWRELQAGYVSLEYVQAAAGDRICFAFGACQYPPGPMDSPMAYRSYQRLGDRLGLGGRLGLAAEGCADHRSGEACNGGEQQEVTSETVGDEEHTGPEFLLLMGDQVYIDASAGLFDPRDKLKRFVKPYHRWLSNPHVRNVLARIPSYAMLDDHEIINDWDVAEEVLGPRFLDDALRSYKNFQRPIPQEHSSTDELQQEGEGIWYSFRERDFYFFMLDSRSERQARGVDGYCLDQVSTPLSQAQLITDSQQEQLFSWLLAIKHKNLCESHPRPCIIVSPSMLLPRRLVTVRGQPASAIHSDAWDGYPATLHKVLAFIAHHRIDNVIFLSGDEHLSSFVEIKVKSLTLGQETRIFSVHSSAFYAPYPFANSSPSLFAGKETFNFECALLNGQCVSKYQCTVDSQFFPGDGFAVMNIEPCSEGWKMVCEFDRESHSSRVERVLDSGH